MMTFLVALSGRCQEAGHPNLEGPQVLERSMPEETPSPPAPATPTAPATEPRRSFWGGTFDAIADPFRRAFGGSATSRGRPGIKRELHKQVRLLFVDVG